MIACMVPLFISSWPDLDCEIVVGGQDKRRSVTCGSCMVGVTAVVPPLVGMHDISHQLVRSYETDGGRHHDGMLLWQGNACLHE